MKTFRCALVTLICWCMVPASSTPAAADNALQVATMEVVAGQQSVVVPVSTTTDQPISLLSVEITFDPAMCEMIATKGIRRAGRMAADPLEGGTRCPDEGKIAVAFLDLMGGTVVPPGDGVIAEWTFDLRQDAAGGTFPLSVAVNQASRGPIEIPFITQAGELVIRGSTSPPAETCPGDCNGDGIVSVNELVLGVNIALGTAAPSECAAGNQGGNGALSIGELVGAVNSALTGCTPD